MSAVPLHVRQAAARELLARDDALSSMWSYREFMKDAHPDFQYAPAPHHDLMIQALHSLEREECKGVLIMAPPGSAKSTYVSVNFATWYAARHPSHHILACSNTTDLAENFNRRRRNVCYSPEWQRLSGTQVSKDQQGISRFGLEAGGTMTAAGVGSAIVGLRSHLNILDDPIQSFEQAMSATQLEKIHAWFSTDFRSRLLPTGKEVIVTTRWSKRDPAGRVLEMIARGEETGWHVLRLPMLADSDDDPMGRVQGEPLWPAWFGLHQIEQNIKDPLRWSALYQQRPLDETGAWVPLENIRVIDSAPSRLNYVIGLDLALSVGKGDFTVMAVCGLDAERVLNVVDLQRHRCAPDETANRLIDLSVSFDHPPIVIDDDPAAKVFLRLVIELARQRNIPLNISPMPLRGRDKETRASALRGFFLQNRVALVNGVNREAAVRELLEFPNGSNDDVVDALGLVARRVAEMSTPTAPTSNRPNWNGINAEDCMFDPETGRSNMVLDELWNSNRRGMRARV